MRGHFLYSFNGKNQGYLFIKQDITKIAKYLLLSFSNTEEPFILILQKCRYGSEKSLHNFG